MLFIPEVAVYETGETHYPSSPPFDPPQIFPEHPFKGDVLDPDNFIYSAVRNTLILLKLDLEHFDTCAWNPLGEIIKPGDRVILKPNLVISDHPEGLPGIQASVVHGSIIRAVLDYVLIANRGQGSISIADSPIKEVDFNRILELTGIGPTVAILNRRYGLAIDLIDFRDLCVTRNNNRVMVDQKRLIGDPLGYQIIDLGAKSMFHEIEQYTRHLRSTAAYYENSTTKAHRNGLHLYSIPKTILQADVLISLPKLKTHRKAGVTINLKNMVGITNEKRWLPHHRIGSPSNGGDLFADETRIDVKAKEIAKDLLITHPWGRMAANYIGIPLLKYYQRMLKPSVDHALGTKAMQVVEDGDWYGNDTVWRMVMDLNTLMLYADKNGRLCEYPQRRFFSIVDGVIGGMEEGPLTPRPAYSGVVLGGFNPVAIDMVGARIMGFDITRIPLIQQSRIRDWLPLGRFSPEDITIYSNNSRWQNIWQSNDLGLNYIPSSGWHGYIELNRRQ